jgi:hypothetical protein
VRVEQAGKDPVRLLEVASLAGEEDARKLRGRVRGLLAEWKPGAPEEASRLARRLAEILPRVARSPAEVEEILGPPGQTARQVLYRRLLEQRHYSNPVALTATFEALKGQDSRLQTVQPTGAEKN